MRNLKKMLLGCVTAMVLAAGVAASPASATVPSQGKDGIGENSNVPYLAWRGEHVRVGFCVSQDVERQAGLVSGAHYNAGWSVEDWSGDPANGSIPVPIALPGTGFASGDCYYDTFSSQKSGVAFIKLTLTDPESRQAVYYHQFMVIWMDINPITVTGGGAVDPADFCNYDTASKKIIGGSLGGFPICDPANDPRHHVKVTVTGNVPLLANFHEWGLGNHITLPTDWALLAARAATCTNTGDPLCHTPGSPSVISNWDIHDDSLLTEGHVQTGGSQCDLPSETNLAGTIDAVDNCRIDTVKVPGANGPFSTVFGWPSAQDTWGPYDPMFPNETLLSDGKVDAGDAPMPAARIDMEIVENNAANVQDISGVGYLSPSEKTDVYSRDGLGTVAAHNLYAPYYSQYIPATSRPVVDGVYPSGIEGAGAVGFNGYLVNGLYDNWGFAWEHSFHPNTDSKCLDQQSYLPFDPFTRYRPLPYGTSSVSVYTDEAGEAVVDFIPGLGMYFDNLLGANKNLNHGCDLEGVSPLGTATINTAARYPYQPVTASDPAGAPVHFTVGNLFTKNLTVYSKGEDANGITSNSLAKIVLAHAQDIDGSPLAYEQICWMTDADAEGARVFVGDLPAPTADDPDAVIHLGLWPAILTGKDPWGMNRLCTFTDESGNSAIEIYNSNGTSVDVIGEFVNEGLLRHVDANFASGNLGGVTRADGPPVAQVPTPAQLKTVVAIGATGPVTVKTTTPLIKTLKSKQAKKAVKVLHKLRFAKVVTPFKGAGKLQVRVNGKAGMVGLKITLKKGKKTVTFTRFVPANRTFTVKNLTIPAKTAKVTVRMIGL